MDTAIENPAAQEQERPMIKEIKASVGEFDHGAMHQEFLALIEGGPKTVMLSPALAAYIYTEQNDNNRALSPAKVKAYVQAIKAGEWMLNHQGIAFYPDGKLADGQHRCAAIASARKPVEVLVFPNFQKEAITTIDLGKTRTAADALDMDGTKDAKRKAKVMKDAMIHHTMAEFAVTHAPVLSNIKVIKAVKENNDALEIAIARATRLFSVTTAPVMKLDELALHLFMMIHYGQVHPEQAEKFFTAVLTGIDDHDGSPALALNKALAKAQAAKRAADKLGGHARKNVIQKGMILWSEQKSCATIKWGGPKADGFLIAQGH